MEEVFVEVTGRESVVYRPSTTVVAATRPSLEGALAYARAEWPALGIRVVQAADELEYHLSMIQTYSGKILMTHALGA